MKNIHRHLGVAVRVGAGVIVASILLLAICPQCFLYLTPSAFTSQQQQSSVEFEEFDYDRDITAVQEAFKTDLYWLTANPDYDVETMFKNRATSNDPRTFGKMQMKVLRDQGNLVGFVTYYGDQGNVGKVLFLYVLPEYRNKSFALKLLNFAVQELNRMGYPVVSLVTRTSNMRAMSLYKRAGFKETSRNDGYVYYQHSM